jgi:heterodisulfide reductase subunit B
VKVLAYYPGCSAHAVGRDLDAATRAAFAALGLDLVDVPDWSCCGATVAAAESPALGQALAARNLDLAAAVAPDLLTPCAACYDRLATAALAAAAPVKIWHPVALLGTPEIARRLARRGRPLPGGPAVVAYHGCLLGRTAAGPEAAAEREHPAGLEDLLAALGVTVRPWPHRTRCCGGPQLLPRPEVAAALSGELLADAAAAGASAVVTACPLCLATLETAAFAARREATRPPALLHAAELVAASLGVLDPAATLDRRAVPLPPGIREWLA